MKTNKQTIKEKINKDIDKYNFDISGLFEKSKNDYLTLKIKVSNEMLDLLKMCIVEKDFVDFNFSNGVENKKYKRHKVKSFILNSLDSYNPNKNLLFEKSFIKKGVLNLKIYNISIVDELTNTFKNNFKKIIEILINCNFEINISYNKENEI